MQSTMFLLMHAQRDAQCLKGISVQLARTVDVDAEAFAALSERLTAFRRHGALPKKLKG